MTERRKHSESLLFQLPTSRVDERDTMFARMAREEGTPAYDDTYARRPELKALDDRLRAMAPLNRPGGLYYDASFMAETERFFDSIESIEPDPEAVEHWAGRLAGPGDRTGVVKAMARTLGAVAAGCCAADEAFAYSNKGRLDDDYGRTIDVSHPSAVVVLVEMDFHNMRRAPYAETCTESARQYYRAAVIAKTLRAALERAGFSAKAHYDAHYEFILPPLAVRAGLGELGRNNILIADRFGSRVRIAAVTTDFPLRYDAPRPLGARHFCSLCRKCSDNCPSGALSGGEPVSVRGVTKWPTRVEQCYRYWRVAGTDCGICMACCPFSHKNNAFHNVVRRIIARWPWTHRTALFFDDLFYGREWTPRGKPPNTPEGGAP